MKAASPLRPPGRGPFRADHLRPGDRYELSDGHSIVREPAGRRHGRRNLTGGAALVTDPAVEVAGVDVGHVLDEATLRAPDVSVGGFADAPGFAPGAPALAVEYAEADCDEADLQRKIGELLASGTRVLWVVHLGDSRRVEVHWPHQPMVVKYSGENLEAPGILRNPFPVDALYDPQAAHEVMLRNLLQRRGHEGLEAVRAEERAHGALAYARERLRRTLASRSIAITPEAERALDGCTDLDTIDAWLDAATSACSLEDVFGSR